MHTLILLQQLDYEGHGWQGKLGDTAMGDSSLEREARTMLRAALVHVDKLTEVGQRGLHLGIRRTQTGPLDSTLKELTGKGRVNRQTRVAAVGRLLLAAVKVASRLACCAAGTGLGSRGEVDTGVAGNTRRGEALEKSLYASKTRLDLVNLALTAKVSNEHGHDWRRMHGCHTIERR